MRLAFITQDFLPETGGIQTYSLEVASRMYEWCDDFVLIAPDKHRAKELDKKLPFDICRINSPNSLLGLLSIPKVLLLLEKRKIDHIFHTQWQTLLLSKIAKQGGIITTTIVAAHARELFFNPFEKLGILGECYKKYQQYLISTGDFFIPISQFTSDALSKWNVPDEKKEVVINGTDPIFFHPLDNQTIKKKLGYEGKKIILTTARLIERKGIDTVIKALPLVIKEIPNVRYVIIGEGRFKGKLKQISQEIGMDKYINFVGKVPYSALNDYYNLSDIYVMPSKGTLPDIEGFGIVFLEANACGKAVIGARTGGVPSAILDGETGLLIKERDPLELSKVIIRLLKNDELRNRLGRQGRKRVLESANWDVVARRIFELIQKVN
ncbi:MAG: phosphatidylinositol alpha-1,6-mannosyltransferase [Maribacter sp.]|jgi:phosphatidylinositol alpha-1,6-mannosyltransferase